MQPNQNNQGNNGQRPFNPNRGQGQQQQQYNHQGMPGQYGGHGGGYQGHGGGYQGHQQQHHQNQWQPQHHQQQYMGHGGHQQQQWGGGGMGGHGGHGGHQGGGGYMRKQNTGYQGNQGGAPRRGGHQQRGGMFGSSPQQRGGHSVVPRGPINLITNNFKIRSQNHGIIYTYSVEFIDGENAALQQALPPPQSQTTADSDQEKAGASDAASQEAKSTGAEESKEQQPTAQPHPSQMHTTYSTNHLETFQKYKILGAQSAKLKSIFVNYVCVGDNIFSTTAIDERIDFETKQAYFGRKFTIAIERVSEFALDDLNSMKMEDHPFALNFINSIIKTQMRNSKLCQIGRNPRFFMPSQAKTFDNAVQTWPGFFTSSWIFQRGLYLIIDNISKNLSVDHCLDLIKEQMTRFQQKRARYSDKLPKQHEIQKSVNDEFKGAIVMACYGHHKTYKVSNVRFDMCPSTCKFEQGEAGTTISMVLYFKQQYDKQIMNLEQPLFEIKQKRQNIYLPPELCMLVGIPQKVRENKKTVAAMRQSLFQKPHDRIRSICELNQMIAQSKEVQQWGLDIQLQPDTIEAKVLEKPKIFETPNFAQQTARNQGGYQQPQNAPQKRPDPDMTNSRVLENSNCLNSMVHEPKMFEKFAIFCLEKDVINAHYINDKFYDLSIQKGLDIKVDYADICPVPDKAAYHEELLLDAFGKAIQNYYDKKVQPQVRESGGTIKHSQFIFLVIMPDHTNHQDFYSFLKNKINCDSPVISQFVANRTICRENDRIFLNIIRQMNAKFGGDLWRMSFGPEISDQTMLVGIDVCHKGKQSTIGFCATYDPHMCKYYAQASPQPVKGQEIISTSVLSDYFRRAFASYRDFNGKMPKHIFIYRDGVGDSMRKQVIDQELEQLHNIISVEYGLVQVEGQEVERQDPPEITLIIVNKRVRQRFFQQTIHHNGSNFIENPPQGTYVDQGFVEQSEVVDGKFDFFLVPHSVTQGSVKPTHFYVAKNTSKISKMAILNFTYALCYNYYNWNDAIKIPAPCMLADKIAGFRSEVGTIPSNVDLHKLPFYL